MWTHQPKGYEPDGELKDCERCGKRLRWKSMTYQNGWWVCKYCVDKPSERSDDPV